MWPPVDRRVRLSAVPAHVDLLISIFEVLDCRSLLAISATCTHWRTIAFSTPALWWDVQLAGSGNLEIFRLFVRRSGLAAVRMDLFCDNSLCVAEGLAAVLQCRTRLVSLTIRLSADFDYKSQYTCESWAPLDVAFEHGFPLLRHLAIHFPFVEAPLWAPDFVKVQDVEQLCALRYAASSESTPVLTSFEFTGVPTIGRSLVMLPRLTVICVQLDVTLDDDIHSLLAAFPALRVLRLVTQDISALANLPHEDARRLSQVDELHLLLHDRPSGYIEGLHLLTSTDISSIRHISLHGLERHAEEFGAVVAALDRPCHLIIGPVGRDCRTQPREQYRTVHVETASGVQRSALSPPEKIWSFARPALECASCTTLTVHAESWKLVFGRSAQLQLPGLLRNVRTLRVLLSPRIPLAELAASSDLSVFARRMPDLERLELRAEPNTIVRVSTDELTSFLKLFEELVYLDTPVFHGVRIYPGRVPAPDVLYLAD